MAEGAIARAELLELGAAAEAEVRGNILPFWLEHAPDRERGGFHGVISDTMEVQADAPRSSLLTSRILWTFARAYREWGELAHLDMARAAHDELLTRFNHTGGRGYDWTVGTDGRPLEPHKQTYGQAFACFGLSELARATGDRAPLGEAIAVHRLIERKARDRHHGGYLDTLTPWWKRDKPESVLSPAQKSKNTHLHLLEAYTSLLRLWPDRRLRVAVRRLIDVILDRLLDRETNHPFEFVTEDWVPLTTDVSCGHDVELSWLILDSATALGDETLLARIRPMSLAIATAALEGVDADGGIVLLGTASDPVDTTKEWWAQAEAVVGFLNAYELSGDERFFDAARASWSFIDRILVDRAHGGWHHAVTRDGLPLDYPKVSVWSCPYHSARSCFEVAARTRRIAAAMR